MSNFYIYRKTLSFSLLKFALDILCLLLVVGLATAGFFLLGGMNGDSKALIGAIIGLIIGVLGVVAISYLVINRVKAAQIAMMVKGVTEDSLPDHTFKAGFGEIKGRFAKITIFFVLTNAIKSVFRQIGRTINRIGTAFGGQAGNTVTSIIDSAIQTLIGYLCDCCLGWVFYRKELNGFKAGMEGAAIFFKHGKTLFRNIGRIFGMGILSFLLIAGGLTGLFYLIFSNAPSVINPIVEAINSTAESGSTTTATIVAFGLAFILAVVIWSMLHSVLVRPFILVGVMRNFMKSGIEHLPSEADMAELSQKYPKFSKLQSRAE